MQRKENLLPFFLVFFGLSLFLVLIGRSGIINSFSSVVNSSSAPLRSSAVDLFSLRSFQNKKINSLIDQNLKLQKELLDKKILLSENKALRSQFENIDAIPSQNLIPAKIIGTPGFIPGVSMPEYLIIDKGSANGVLPKSTVIVGNYLIGKIVITSDTSSKIELIISKKSSFTAKVSDSDISGIIKGNGNEKLILDNVLLTENLKKDSAVLTKGDRGEKGEGYPPDIAVGKIVSIEKKSSDLFQRAEVRSPLDFRNLNYVFVLK